MDLLTALAVHIAHRVGLTPLETANYDFLAEANREIKYAAEKARKRWNAETCVSRPIMLRGDITGGG